MPSLDDVPWPLTTPRLTLRRVVDGDAEATFAYRRLPEVSEWSTATTTDLDAWTERLASAEVRATMVVVERDGQVVGDLLVRVGDGWAQKEVETRAMGVEAEIGYAIAPSHHGHGYGTEAARAALEICFDHVHVRRVIAGCFVANTASWRIMERLGMRREQHSVRDGLHRTRGWLDGYTYALLADEWRAQDR